jgi:hypothetical protein
MSDLVDHLIQRWLDLLAWLSALTLGQVWKAIYNPPTPLNLSIALIALTLKAPTYYRRYTTWRASRRVVRFDWPLPEVSSAS